MKKKILIVLGLVVVAFCFFLISRVYENRKIEERVKEFDKKQLQYFIAKYSSSTDEYCTCVAEKKVGGCDDVYQSIITIRKAMDVSLAECNDKLAYSANEYSEIKKKINAITDKLNKCTQ